VPCLALFFGGGVLLLLCLLLESHGGCGCRFLGFLWCCFFPTFFLLLTLFAGWCGAVVVRAAPSLYHPHSYFAFFF
jgi:hypothetical protein